MAAASLWPHSSLKSQACALGIHTKYQNWRNSQMIILFVCFSRRYVRNPLHYLRNFTIIEKNKSRPFDKILLYTSIYLFGLKSYDTQIWWLPKMNKYFWWVFFSETKRATDKVLDKGILCKYQPIYPSLNLLGKNLHNRQLTVSGLFQPPNYKVGLCAPWTMQYHSNNTLGWFCMVVLPSWHPMLAWPTCQIFLLPSPSSSFAKIPHTTL